MKSLGYYLGYIKGYFLGYFGGKRAGKWFVKAMTEYGGLEHIPTREIQKRMGASAEMMIARQRLKLATIALRHLAASYVNNDLTHTLEAVADYLEFKLPSDKRMDAVAHSQAVLHALADYAQDKDELNIANLREAMDVKNNGHYWHMFEDNVMLRVN